jgi:hypothetical protein
MEKWWQRIIQIRAGLVSFGLWLAVLILPLKVEQLPAALLWWANIMPELVPLVWTGWRRI